MQAENNFPTEVRVVVEIISKSVEMLVASCRAHEPYPELDKLCKYVQWIADFKQFERASAEYMQRIKDENEASVLNARRDFRIKHAYLRERILWDWCPFWQVLSTHPDFLKTLPTLPWNHDGLCYNALPFSRLFLFDGRGNIS